MFYGEHVEQTRKLFFESWQKVQNRQPLEPLEQQIAEVIADHPEYHALFMKPPSHLDQAYFPELGVENPFLHLGLHLTVRDQVHLNRPQGISALFQQLAEKKGCPLKAEHEIMECLAQALWHAQKTQSPPDEQAYLQAIREKT